MLPITLPGIIFNKSPSAKVNSEQMHISNQTMLCTINKTIESSLSAATVKSVIKSLIRLEQLLSVCYSLKKLHAVLFHGPLAHKARQNIFR